MKKLLLALTTLTLTACASSENYYLKNYSINENLQEKATTEIILENVVYAKVLTNKEAIAQFGKKAKGYTVVFFQTENIGDDTSFFSFEKATIIDDENTVRGIANLGKVMTNKEIDFTKSKNYMNPFRDTEMEDNSFDYNINQKVLTNFALQPNGSAKGFLMFEELDDAEELRFMISSGVSIHSFKENRSIKLERD